MKGDYTLAAGVELPPGDGDHPQMKGDYTLRMSGSRPSPTETTPK